MDNGSQTEMVIERLRYGGFLVRSNERTPGAFNPPVFAASDVDDALKFIRNAIAPIGPQQSR